MKRLFGVLALAAVLAMAPSAWAGTHTIQHYDCKNVSDYMKSNAQTIQKFMGGLVPVVGTTDSMVPWEHHDGNVDWVGLAVGIFDGFIQVGVSPSGAMNVALHLVCLDLVNAP